MTKPTLTYSHGYMTDCDTETDWSADGAHEDGNTATMSVLYGDWFDINVSNSVGNKVCYYEYDLTNISSDVYTTFLVRYKTSSASIKAKVVLVFTDGSQTVLSEDDTLVWVTATADITASKTIDKIQLYANQDTGHVYYDFALICVDNWTLPFVSELEQIEFTTDMGYLKSPGRIGEIPQYVGSESPLISLSGTMNKSTTASWKGDYSKYGQYFETMWFRVSQDPWQWFTSDDISCKVTPLKLTISKVAGNRQARTWDLILKKYDLSDGSNYGLGEYFGWD